jgi:DNA-binding response OmpR family regulator
MNIPILMISAHPDAERTCRLAGADEILEKPFEIDKLINKVDVFSEKLEY